MSLIADALKAAESRRAAGADRSREAARQLLGRPGDRRTPIRGATEWLYQPVRFPRHVGIASGIVGGALAVAAAIVLLRPLGVDPMTTLAAEALAGGPAAEEAARGAEGLAGDPMAAEEAARRAEGLAGASTEARGVGGDEALADGQPASRATGVGEALSRDQTNASAAAGAEALGRGSTGARGASGGDVRPDASSSTDIADEPATTDSSRADEAPILSRVDAPPAMGDSPRVATSGSIGADGDVLTSSPANPARELSSAELRVKASARANGVEFADAVAAQRRHDYARAVELYESILEANPNDVEVLNNLGVSHQALGEMEAARDAFQRALAIQPKYPAAWSNLGVVLGALGRDADARTAFAEALRQDPGNLGTKVNLALLHQRQGLPSEAKRLLEEVIEADPSIPEAHFALAGIYEDEGNVSAALRQYRQFIATSAGRFPDLVPRVADRIRLLEGRAR